MPVKATHANTGSNGSESPMKIAGLVAKGIAALISFVLLLSSPAAVATEETSKASLLGIETLDTGQYAYRVSLQLDNRVERLLLNEYSELNQLKIIDVSGERHQHCLLYTSPSPRDATLSRMPSSA